MTCDRAAQGRRLRCDFAVIRMEWALIKLAWKYRSDQPRVPAGNPDGGQWTDGGGGIQDRFRQEAPDWPSTHTDDLNRFVRVAANDSDPLVPNGVYALRVPHNPLDPKNINPLTMPWAEQQQVADAVNKVNSGMTVGMRGHTYENRPEKETGAMLPPSAGGYMTYDIGPKSGKQRLLVDSVTRQMYYTNNHYRSFWIIVRDSGSGR